MAKHLRVLRHCHLETKTIKFVISNVVRNLIRHVTDRSFKISHYVRNDSNGE